MRFLLEPWAATKPLSMRALKSFAAPRWAIPIVKAMSELLATPSEWSSLHVFCSLVLRPAQLEKRLARALSAVIRTYRNSVGVHSRERVVAVEDEPGTIFFLR